MIFCRKLKPASTIELTRPIPFIPSVLFPHLGSDDASVDARVLDVESPDPESAVLMERKPIVVVLRQQTTSRRLLLSK